MALRHFIKEDDLSAQEFRTLLARASELKRIHKRKEVYEPLKNRTLAMIFEKASTRTRVSFEAGMAQLGGHAINLTPESSQLGRGEPLHDTAMVLSEMVDAVMIRTYSQQNIQDFANSSRIPVINGLTDLLHPCQLLADMQTWFDHRGDIKGRTVAWIGDGNNMCNSYINCARILGFRLNIACPAGHEPDAALLQQAEAQVEVTTSPADACLNADLIVTDVWASMGQEEEKADRQKKFASYCVDERLMKLANADALFMHCLPAHRGEEVTPGVIDGRQSVVWEEAGNRLHAQKALLEFLLTADA